MAILVDELRDYPGVALPFSSWCHMATDGEFDELHAFAARLGLRRAWFQRDHYDLPPHGRAAAVAHGAEEVSTGEMLRRMAGPRGDRARSRALAPAGVTWLRGSDGPAVLRYPPGSLVVIGGPPGAGKSTLAARVVDRTRVPLLDPDETRNARGLDWEEALAAWRDDLVAALAAGAGAVAVTTALRHGYRLGLTKAAATAGVPAHLVMLDADAERCRAGRAAQGSERISDGLFEHLLREWDAFRRALSGGRDPDPFASVTVLDRMAAHRLRRVDLLSSTRG
jgi:predicted kinase